MQNFGLSMLWFWVCYFLVTLVGIAHTCFNIIVLHMSSMKEGPGMGEGYERTKPWHPLYNLVLFPRFGCLYMKGISHPNLHEALLTGAVWAVVCIVVDYIGWVLIRHPWHLTVRQFYVEYQPWITLIYLTIFLGPVLGYALCMGLA